MVVAPGELTDGGEAPQWDGIQKSTLAERFFN